MREWETSVLLSSRPMTAVGLRSRLGGFHQMPPTQVLVRKGLHSRLRCSFCRGIRVTGQFASAKQRQRPNRQGHSVWRRTGVEFSEWARG